MFPRGLKFGTKMGKKLEKLIEEVPEIEVEPVCAARIVADKCRNLYWVYGRIDCGKRAGSYLLVQENPRRPYALIPVASISDIELMRIRPGGLP